MLMDIGLSEACERTGTYVAQSPQRARPSDSPESQRQQQRSSMRNQHQQHNLTREYEFESPIQRMDLSDLNHCFLLPLMQTIHRCSTDPFLNDCFLLPLMQTLRALSRSVGLMGPNGLDL